MFALTTLVYPCVLAVLCLGAGLAIDRVSGRWLPGPALGAVGAAALIALSQLTTYIWPLASATPALMAALAAGGLLLGAPRLRGARGARRASGSLGGTRVRGSVSEPRVRGAKGALSVAAPPLIAAVAVYLLALSPVLVAGRASFSSYLSLGDSAFHIAGADFLMDHGMHFSSLDPGSSYGQAIRAYYDSGYPSGADTLLGGSAFLLGLPLIWAFQPFNAFMLALAAGPVWLLLRRMGLGRVWAVLGAVSATVPALVFGYELIGSIKEIAALPMLLGLGALLAVHARWLRAGPAAAIPFALLAAGGVSALGAGFGVWALASAAVLLTVLALEGRAGRAALQGRAGRAADGGRGGPAGHAGRTGRARGAGSWLGFTVVGSLVTLVAALPTWLDLGASVSVTETIASTSNPGNLHTPLHASQLLGSWLQSSYKQGPTGAAGAATWTLVAVTATAALLGAAHLLRTRRLVVAGWLSALLLVWLISKPFVTTWVAAKVLVLTAPAVALLAWAGLAALTRARVPALVAPLAIVLAGGVLASDALQYHGSNLAPTARYQELASINSRFANAHARTLFTDYDEYSLYELRDMNVAGPDFLYGPPGLARAGPGYRNPVELEALPPAALARYALIVTRRNPAARRPPSAYGLAWRGRYYEVWRRKAAAQPALATRLLAGPPARDCAEIRATASRAGASHARLIAALEPTLVRVSPARWTHPRSWRRSGPGLTIRGAGHLTARFSVPSGGEWQLWLQGQFMPSVEVDVDGRRAGAIGGQLGGDSLVPDTATPLQAWLRAGTHRLAITHSGATLAPGDGGAAVLQSVFLTPAAGAPQPLRTVAAAGWRSLCGRSYGWVELVRA